MNYIILLAASAIFLLIALKDLRWAIFAIAALLPAYLWRFDFYGLPSTFLEVMLVITIIIFFTRLCLSSLQKGKSAPELGGRGGIMAWCLPILLFLAAGIISIFVSPDSWKALGLFRAYLLLPILFFFAAVSALRDKRDAHKVISAFALSAIVISIYAVFQRFTAVGIPDAWAAERRVTSFYPFPNAVGLFLAPLLPLFLTHVFLDRKRLWHRLYFGIAAALGILAIFLAKTEGALAALLAAGILLGLFYRRARIPAIIIGIALAAGVLLSPFSEKILLKDWSGHVRRVQWSETLAMLADRPVFGAGLSGYPETIEPYHKAAYIEIFQYPHNIILNFWSELGLIGILAFAWILLIFFRLIKSAAKTQNSGIVMGLLATVLVIIIHGLVDVPYFKNDLAVQFWLFAALASVLSGQTKILRS